ncbi:hypothetical protein ACJX0J_029894, partial [Zea mays]
MPQLGMLGGQMATSGVECHFFAGINIWLTISDYGNYKNTLCFQETIWKVAGKDNVQRVMFLSTGKQGTHFAKTEELFIKISQQGGALETFHKNTHIQNVITSIKISFSITESHKQLGGALLTFPKMNVPEQTIGAQFWLDGGILV